MAYNDEYVSSQFRLAFKILVGKDSVQKRLEWAISSNLHKLRTDIGNDFPVEFHEEWNEISQNFSKFQSLSDEEAEKLAERIVDFYFNLHKN